MKKIFLFLICHLLVVDLTYAFTDATESWEAHFKEQFKKLQAYNERCVAEGRPDEKIYFFGYTPFEDILLTNDCEETQWWKYWLKPEPDSAFLSGTFCQEIKCALQDFNEGISCSGVRKYNNPDDVKVYAAFLNYWGFLDASAPKLKQEDKLTTYIENNEPASYKEYLDEHLKEVRRFKFLEKGDGGTLLVYTSRYAIYGGESKVKKALYKSNIKGKADASKECIAEHALSLEDSQTYPAGTPDMLSAKQFFDKVMHTLSFYSTSNEERVCTGCDKEFLNLIKGYENVEVRKFLLSRCQELKEDARASAYLFEIADILEGYAAFIPIVDGDDVSPSTRFLTSSYEDYGVILKTLEDEKLSTEEQLAGLLAALRRAVAAEDALMVYRLMYFLVGDGAYNEHIPLDLRQDILNVLSWYLPNNIALGYREQVVIDLINGISDADACAFIEFLKAEQDNSLLLERLIYRIRDWFLGGESAQEFMIALSRLASRGNCGENTSGDRKTFLWKSENGVSANYKVNMTDSLSLKIHISADYCTEEEITVLNGGGILTQGPNQCVAYHTLDYEFAPFEMIDILLLDKVRVVDICGIKGCEDNKIENVPAILVYYILTQERNLDFMIAAQTAFEIGLVFVGAAELSLAIRAASVSRIAVSGYYLASDIYSFSVNSSVMETFLKNLYQDEQRATKILSYLNKVDLINGVLSLNVDNIATKLAKADDAAQFVASVERIREDVPEADLPSMATIAQNGGDQMTNEELFKYADAVKAELQASEEGQSLLRRYRAELAGIADLDGLIKQYTVGWSDDAIERITNRILKEDGLADALRNGGSAFAEKLFGLVVNTTDDIKDLFGITDNTLAQTLLDKINQNPFKNNLLDNGYFVIIKESFGNDPTMLNRLMTDILENEDLLTYLNDAGDLDAYQTYLRVFPDAVFDCK